MLEKLIKNGESDALEFKSSLRTPVQPNSAITSIERLLENQKARRKIYYEEDWRKLEKLINSLEHEIIKTVAFPLFSLILVSNGYVYAIILGCMSVEGNTEKICESATDK